MLVEESADENVELLLALLQNNAELEWLEFKSSLGDPERIARYISGLANTAALLNRHSAYVVWGVEDETRRIIGTDFSPRTTKVKGQELELWLARATPGAVFAFIEFEFEGAHMVILRVHAAADRPVECLSKAYIRVGSSLVELKTDKDREGRLWDILRNKSFEEGTAMEAVAEERVQKLLDLGAYFARSRQAHPASLEDLLAIATTLGLLRPRDDGRWDITNLGALLFARELSSFPTVSGKSIRVVQYEGDTRAQVVRRQDGAKGYAVGFMGLLSWLKAVLPAREVYVNGERTEQLVYTDLLLREVLANAMVHQDLTVRGSGPRVEIFNDRIEVSNPGRSLVAVDRLINHPPLARNSALANLMLQMRLCENHGTGWDRIAMETEDAGLPSPTVQSDDDSMRVTILGPRKLTTMQREDQKWIVYAHACLQYANHKHLTNGSLRDRFGISTRNSSQVSRLIAYAVEDGLIELFDESVGTKSRSYVPYWARLVR
ncbi:hypothetical protein AS029_07645 [Microbacterium enclense]|nr:hypothetical protein AS029_07645 [Microbacterium enclense]